MLPNLQTSCAFSLKRAAYAIEVSFISGHIFEKMYVPCIVFILLMYKVVIEFLL